MSQTITISSQYVPCGYASNHGKYFIAGGECPVIGHYHIVNNITWPLILCGSVILVATLQTSDGEYTDWTAVAFVDVDTGDITPVEYTESTRVAKCLPTNIHHVYSVPPPVRSRRSRYIPDNAELVNLSPLTERNSSNVR